MMDARSSGSPTRLLRKASVTNSSISLPTVRVRPRTMAPAASSALGPLAAKARGLRNAAIKPICWSLVGCSGSAVTGLKLASKRSMVSVSIEWPKR
ncbi:hypothetical protein D9M68_615420 [compost metagenome]